MGRAGGRGGPETLNWAQTGPNWAQLGRTRPEKSEPGRKEAKLSGKSRRGRGISEVRTELYGKNRTGPERSEVGRKEPNWAGSKGSGPEVDEGRAGRVGKSRTGDEVGRKEPKVSGNCRSAAMLLPLLLGLLEVSGALGGCVEVASGTEAVLGAPFRLLCIACKRRSETPAEAESEWFFRPEGAPQFEKILHYSPEEGEWVAPGPFFGVISWNGSRGTRDLQDLSVWLMEVKRSHAGQYVCRLKRNLTFEGYTYSLARNQTLRLAVVEKARRDLASIVSEILMYVLIVVLTLWLAAEMLYCYRKVAAASPPPDSASEYLAITSESKENCGGVQVAE